MRSIFRITLSVAFVVTLSAVVFAHDGDGKSLDNAGSGGSGGTGPYNAFNVTLSSHMDLESIGGGGSVIGSDIWGWTDSNSGRQFALMGLTNGTSFIEVTDPFNPVFMGKLDTHEPGQNRAWRDIKVFNDHAFIVADGSGNDHGMQVYDLRQLVTPTPAFTATSHYDGFTSAHNIVINEDTGFAYVVGRPRGGSTGGGLHVLDLNDLGNISVAGTFAEDGYTHDAQAVIYNGPDSTYAGREVVFAANEDSLTIVDVSDKANMTQISKRLYADSEYAHQGWLSEDQKYFFMNDELDERENFLDGNDPFPTRTLIWDVQDLDAPFLVGVHEGTENTIDHNLYVKDDLIFQANYTAGMRVLKMVDPANGILEEVGFFDTYMADNDITFNGAWSVFPYFDDGTILISDRQGGLFVVAMVPEPSSFGFLLIGTLTLGTIRRKKSA
jgi:choice-of-anchor B domain-containing protein